MSPRRNPFEDNKAWVNISIPPAPSTTSVLAMGFLAGCLMFTPMIAWVGKYIEPEYRESVMLMAGLFKDGMLLILGFYFAKVVNQGQTDMANKAIETAAASTPASTVPANAAEVASVVSDYAAEAAATVIQTAEDTARRQEKDSVK